MPKVSMVMATQVAMDVAPAQRSIRSLTTNLNILTRSSKAQAANFRSAGDALNSSKAEYEGFSIALGRAKNLMADLTKQQTNLINAAKNQDQIISTLRGKISDLQAERQKVNRTTIEGKEKWAELTEQIRAFQKQLRDTQRVDTRLNTTNRQINSLTANIARMTTTQQRAKQAFSESKSGLTALQEQYQKVLNVSNAYTSRLRAEGSTAEAEKSRIETVRELRKNLTEQLSKQQDALDKLRKAEGDEAADTSDERIAVEQTKQRIAEATNEIEKYKDQQTGLSALQQQYERISAASSVYSERLRAEGNAAAANRNDLSTLRTLRENLTNQLDRQEAALERVRRAEGEEAAAESQERIAVEQTRAKIAETTQSIDKLSNAGRGSRLGNAFKAGFNQVNEGANQTEAKLGHLHGVWLGTFAGNVVSNAASTTFGVVKRGLGGLIETGMKYNAMEQTMTASWDTLTGSAEKGADMQNMLNGLAQKAQNSVPMVDQLAQKIYAVTNSKDQTHDLTQSILTLQDAFHVDDAAIQNFGLQWSQMIGNGKASAQDMLSVQTVFPKFREELLAYERQVTGNANLTMQQMNQMMSKGKISSQAMNTVLLKMGQEYSGATQNFASTTDGMKRTIQAMWPKLAGEATEGLSNIQNPVFRAVSNWVSDPRTDQAFKNLGQRVGMSISMIVDSLNGGKSVTGDQAGAKMTQNLNKAINSIDNAVDNVGIFVQRNGLAIRAGLSMIGSAFKIAGSVARQAFVDLVNVVGNLLAKNNGQATSFTANLQRVSNVMKTLSNNRAAIQTMAKVLLGFFAVKGALKFIATITQVAFTLGRFAHTVVMVGRAIHTALEFTKLIAMTNPALLFSTGIVALITILVKLYQHNKKFRDFCNGMVKSARDMFSQIGKNISSFGKSFGRFFTQTIPNILKNAGKFMLTASRFMVNPIGTTFMLLYKHSPQFRNFTNGLVKDMRNGARGVGNWIGNMSKAIANFFTKSIPNAVRQSAKAIHSAIIDVIKFIEKPINSFLNDAVDKINKVGSKAHLPKLGKLQLSVPSFATGTGTDADQMAIVNDATSGPYREAMVYNNRISLFPQGRNLLQFIPAGAQILNGKNTEKLLERLPHFADGAGQVNTLISGLQENGNLLHEAQRKIFYQKIQAQLQKLLKEFRKELKEATKQLHKAIKEAKQEFTKTMYGNGKDGGAYGQRDDSTKKANQTYANSTAKAQESLNNSLKSAKDSNAVQSAYNTYSNAITQAYNTRADSLEKANRTFRVAYTNASMRESTAVTNAENVYSAARDAYLTNRRNAGLWAQNNRDQFMQGLPQFATGGIATAPSIFGEAGPEMAIPLTGDPGHAMELMGQVADNFRAGNTTSQTDPLAERERHDRAMESKVDKLCSLLAQMLEGQTQQTGVIASKPGYDKERAYNDLANTLTNENFGALTI